MVKVLLIVVQGKPEGKTIPLAGPVFRIGRGAECHLRPNSEEVSRQHAEVTIGDDGIFIRDLGSRNGTRVNGKLLTEPYPLKSGELVQIGPLTFAVSIQGAPATPAAPAPVAAVAAAVDGTPPEQIESWLVAGSGQPTPDRPSGVYDGDTLTISAYREKEKDDSAPKAGPPAAEKADSETGLPAYLRGNLEFETLEEGAGDPEEEAHEVADEGDEAETAESAMPEEMIDESNPFYAAKKAQAESTSEAAGKPSYKDSSDAASDILRKMLDRRRAH